MSSLSPRKRRRLSLPKPQNNVNNAIQEKDFTKSSAQWNLEQDYESRGRSAKRTAKNAERLPIKTAEGKLEVPLTADADELKSDDSGASDLEPLDDVQPVQCLQSSSHLPDREQILEAKETLARVATLISENPEEHADGFRILAQFANSPNFTIKKLALASQLAVFKDVIPGYRIRPQSSDPAEKLSKETRQLRSYEVSLVNSYQSYVKQLTQYAKLKSDDVPQGVTTIPAAATACACGLLLAIPHFNFRGDLLQIVIDKLGDSTIDPSFVKCCETLERLFENDDDGKPSLDAVVALARMMKMRNYDVDEAVLNTLLRLRLLLEFSYKGSQKAIDRRVQDASMTTTKKARSKVEFHTKSQRKLIKERKAVENDYKEADAIVRQEERDKLHSETLKVVFVTYFRILRTRSRTLMGAVLEGLAKFAHLINQDFFGDLLEVLKDISTQAGGIGGDQNALAPSDQEIQPRPARDSGRSSLLCAITAFALLEGQDIRKSASDLQLDLSFFVSYLYRNLAILAVSPDVERGASSSSSRKTPQPATQMVSKVNIQTTTALLLRILRSILLPSATSQPSSSVPKLRVAAFTKQVMMCSLQMPEKSATAMIHLATSVSKVHGRRINSLWNTEESKGDGVFDISGERGIEGSNVFTSTVWEGEILKSHFCPNVRDSISVLEKTVLGGN